MSDIRNKLHECLTGVCEDGTFKGISQSLDELEVLFAARDAEVAGLREALDNARESMMDLRKESPRRRLVEGMERTRDIVRKALAANPTSERVVVSREVSDMIDNFRKNHFDKAIGEYRWGWLEGAIHALLQRKGGR